MKVKNISDIFFLLIIIFHLCVIAYADKQKIKIGLRESDMPDVITIDMLNVYRQKLNNYFIEKTKDNEKLNKYELDIYFYPYPESDINGRSLLHMLMVKLCKKLLPNREYDMLVLDDRILLNEIALMESEWVFQNNHVRHPSLELFHDLSKYIKKEDLKFHDQKIVKGGMFENRIIGVPFEFDFNVIYYHKEELNSKKYNDTQILLDNMENLTWKELLETMNSKSQPFRMSFGDDDNLLNFVTEYISNQYTLSSKYDPDYLKLLYNDTSIEIYTELYDSIISTFKGYNTRMICTITLENTFMDFIQKNITFFNGKASHNIIFKSNYSNDEIPLTLPPKFQSTTIHKYLVANKYSKINLEILAEVALVLTDKDAQLFRSEIFNTIPTFDFSNKDSDEVQIYCKNNPVICNAMDKMKKLYVRDIFQSNYLVPFYEIIGFIPIKFKNLFIVGEVDYVRKAFKNANEFITDNMGSYKLLSILVTLITIIGFLLVIYMTYRLREHTYIKVISPLFCNLIIVGCILNLLKIFEFLPPYSSTKIKVFLIIGTIGTNLIYIPMFAVAYRIFRIYKTKTIISKALINKRLLIYIIIAVSVAVIYNIVIVFTERFYYTTIGSVNSPRFPIGYYSNFNLLHKIYQVYLTLIVSSSIKISIFNNNRLYLYFIYIEFLSFIFFITVYIINIYDYCHWKLFKKIW